jgi:hypothetical protein
VICQAALTLAVQTRVSQSFFGIRFENLSRGGPVGCPDVGVTRTVTTPVGRTLSWSR